MQLRIHLLAAAFVAVVAAGAAAETIRVPKDQPTIQDAVDAAADGDLIVVKKNTYDENVVVDGNAGKNNLTIRGIGKPTIDGGAVGDCLTIVNATGVTVTGMQFTNAQVNGVLVQQSSDIEISKCTAFENSCANNTNGSGIRLETSSNVTIEKCTFEDNCVYAIYLYDPVGDELTSCTIEKNKLTGGEHGLSFQGTGHMVTKNKLTRVGDIAIFLDDESANLTFEKNNVQRSGGYGFLAVGGTGHTITKNKYVRSGDIGLQIWGDNILVDGDKSLRSSSTGVYVSGGTNITLRGLKVVGSGDNGIEVRGSGHLIENCKLVRTKEDAFKVRDGGNTFRNNSAKNSRARDLDENGGLGVGANTYENNKFDPDKISPAGLVF